MLFKFLLGCSLLFFINGFCIDINKIENKYLKKNKRAYSYKSENFGVIEAEDLCDLGKLTALIFLKWVENNPKGVIALPTGKTPEYFIKYLHFYKTNWQNPPIQKELRSYNINSKTFPNTSDLTFVQIDEFFPINPKQQNSFSYFLNLPRLKAAELFS